MTILFRLSLKPEELFSSRELQRDLYVLLKYGEDVLSDGREKNHAFGELRSKVVPFLAECCSEEFLSHVTSFTTNHLNVATYSSSEEKRRPHWSRVWAGAYCLLESSPDHLYTFHLGGFVVPCKEFPLSARLREEDVLFHKNPLNDLLQPFSGPLERIGIFSGMTSQQLNMHTGEWEDVVYKWPADHLQFSHGWGPHPWLWSRYYRYLTPLHAYLLHPVRTTFKVWIKWPLMMRYYALFPSRHPLRRLLG